jgi:hypothetical protein
VAGYFGREYWCALGGKERPKEQFDKIENVRGKSPDTFGLSRLEVGGGAAVIQKGSVRGIWIEEGQYGKYSIMYMSVAGE